MVLVQSHVNSKRHKTQVWVVLLHVKDRLAHLGYVLQTSFIYAQRNNNKNNDVKQGFPYSIIKLLHKLIN